jgi:glycosyltransferase involved in cell wall biosynthesis
VLTSGSGACVVDEREDDFAAAVVHVLKNRELARNMGEKGRAWAAKWSSIALARRMAEMYRELRPASLALA